MGGWKRGLVLVGLVVSMGGVGVLRAGAQMVTTPVADVVYRADGTTAGGSVVISWNAFTMANGEAVAAGVTSVTLGTGGTLSVALAPNAGATPMGSYYTAVFHLDDGTVTRQYWVVPVAVPGGGAAKLAGIGASVLPLSVAMQTVSKQYVDGAIAAAIAAASVGGGSGGSGSGSGGAVTFTTVSASQYLNGTSSGNTTVPIFCDLCVGTTEYGQGQGAAQVWFGASSAGAYNDSIALYVGQSPTSAYNTSQVYFTSTGESLTAMETMGWTSSATNAGTANTPRSALTDTGFSREAADVVDCGNGAQGDRSCTLQAASFVAGSYTESLTTPASSSAACAVGQFTDDANFHYVCVSANVWRRVALSSF